MLCIFSRGRHKHKHKHTTQTFLSRVSYVIVVNTFRNIALNSIHSDQSCVVWFLFHFLNGNLENWLFDLNHDQSPSFFKTNIRFYVARFRRRARKICDFIDLSPNDCIRLECVRSVGHRLFQFHIDWCWNRCRANAIGTYRLFCSPLTMTKSSMFINFMEPHKSLVCRPF